MREDRVWPAILVLIWLASAAVWLTPGLTIPDGAGYYVYLPSTYFDRDLLFFDEWQQAGLIRDGRILHKEVTATDHLGNHWTVGPALFWYPAFLLGDGLRSTFPPLQRFGRNGFSLPYNVPVALSSAVAGLIALVCGYRVSKPLVGPRIAALASAGIWFGTPLMWYSLRNGVMSHAVSAMACALAFVVVLRLRDKTDWRSWMLAGLVCGFAFVVRPQNAPVLLLPLFLTRLSSPGTTAFAGGAALSTLPQLIVSFHLYGNPLAFLWGGGGEPFAAMERIWWWEVLLSWYHGLIPWAPATALSLAGLVLLFRRDRGLALACWFLLLSQWFINAVMERSFWGAYAFGQRRFDNCTIVFLIGLAVLLARLKPLVSVALVAATSLWTLSLFLAAGSLDLNDYYTPTELLNASLEAWRNAKFELLVFVPPRGKALVALLAVATLILWTGLTLLVRRRAVEVASVYLLCISAFLAWCGWNGQRHVDSYTDLIRYNRLPEVKARNADWRVDLLRHEVLYLEKSGRSSEAARARRDFEAAMRKMEN